MTFVNDPVHTKTYDPDRGFALKLEKIPRDHPEIYFISNAKGEKLYFWATPDLPTVEATDQLKMTWIINKIVDPAQWAGWNLDQITDCVSEAMIAYGFRNNGTTSVAADIAFSRASPGMRRDRRPRNAAGR